MTKQSVPFKPADPFGRRITPHKPGWRRSAGLLPASKQQAASRAASARQLAAVTAIRMDEPMPEWKWRSAVRAALASIKSAASK